MARDATARLYDVDENSVVYKRPKLEGKYDHGTIAFRGKRGRLVNLDKLHESVWATRLSGGTRSGLVSLDVTVLGNVAVSGDEFAMEVTGSEKRFVIAANPDGEAEAASAFERLKAAIDRGESVVSVTGRLQGWAGRWPDVLQKLPRKPRRIMVADFQTAKE